MINDLLSKLSCFEQDFIYRLIPYQDLKLCLDVGAAAGVITRRIKQSGSTETRVLAFEPFEGNHKYFLENTQSLENVELVKKAASTQTGVAKFRILSTVTGNEKGWERMPGYSSTGFLMKDQNSDESQHKAVPTSPSMQEISVETVVIDDIVHSHVDFMKIDVQGGEMEVLKGCQNVIVDYGIDVMYIEFNGESEILDFLNFHGYTVFDTDYLVISRDQDKAFLQTLGFYDFKDLNLSTGRKAYRARLRLPDREYCSFLKDFREKHGYIYTDLICVHERFLDQFLINLSQLISSEISKETVAQKNISRKGSSTADKSIMTTIEQRQKGVKRTAHTNPVAKESQKVGLDKSFSLGLALLQRIVNYYSRWTILIAVMAVFFNAASLLGTSLGWLLLAIGTTLLLFLTGHAASKADYVLAEVEKIKKQQFSDSSSRKRKK